MRCDTSALTQGTGHVASLTAVIIEGWRRRARSGALTAAMAALLGVATPALAAPAGPPPASGVAHQDDVQQEPEITVMARNLYLGADVFVALELLPDLPAAAQFMWDQVATTDFDARVGELAAEAVRYRPDIIGLQEATVWSCRAGLFGGVTPVYDFTEQFLAATAAAGEPYVVAEKDGVRAENPGYQIPAIPFLTTVEDPETFQPIFGTDTADCGFTIGDTLLVRADLADSVVSVGTSEYTDRYAVVPVVFTIDRGYSWADLAIGGTTVRVVTTHLESSWDQGSPAPSVAQARQLVADLTTTTVPLVVVGDFNADPRDPRSPDAPNPAGQPEAYDACPPQPSDLTLDNGDLSCNAFWTMLDAGYTDAGPDVLDPVNYTYGGAADLAGPDPARVTAALEMGNTAGFTDRLDHVFVANGASVETAQVIGNEWPDGEAVWACDDPSQVTTTEESSAALADAGVGSAITGRGVCLPTDHAGLVVSVDVAAGPDGVVTDPAPESHDSFRIGLLGWIGIVAGVLLLVLVLLAWGLVSVVRRRRRRRAMRSAAAR